MENHQHQHVIPVEWAYIHNIVEGNAKYHDATPIAKRVTRLLCACGDVKELRF